MIDTGMVHWNRRQLAAVVTGVFAFFAAVSSAIPAFALEPVTLRLDWVIGSEHAAIFAAREKGFFAEENIDLKIQPGEGSTVTVKLVGNRDTEFGYAAADQVLVARSRDLPVVATAVILQRGPGAIVFRKDSGIKTLTDLYGKRLGVQFKSTTEKQWRAVQKLAGIDPTKINEVGADRAIATLIAAERIDAGVAFYFNDGLKLITEGIDTEWILFSDLGLQMYSSSLITNAELIKENPDLVRRFTRAFVKGWTFAVEHPTETLELFLQSQPTADRKFSTLKLPEVLQLTATPDTKANGIGHSTLEAWQSLQNGLIEMEIMPHPIDVGSAFTNEYLK